MITYRKAKFEDRDICMEFLEKFLAEAEAALGVQMSITKVYGLLAHALRSDEWRVLIADNNGEAVGILVLSGMEHPFGIDVTVTELAFWLSPEQRNLKSFLAAVKAAEDWGKSIGAKRVVLGSLPKLKDLTSLFQRFGYQLSELAFSKEL